MNSDEMMYKWKKLSMTARWTYIGFSFGFILAIGSLVDIWDISGVIGWVIAFIYLPFLFSSFIFESLLKFCSSMGCFVFMVLGGVLIYSLIGLIVGKVISIRRK
jgi:hypothetical protein